MSNRSLTFDVLRAANMQRLPVFKNKHGEPAHSKPDGSDWSRSDWLEAIVGELGEYANNSKKLRAGDLTPAEFKVLAAKELADVQIYLDILAFQLDIDLGRATIEKWNEVARRIKCGIRIDWFGVFNVQEEPS